MPLIRAAIGLTALMTGAAGIVVVTAASALAATPAEIRAALDAPGAGIAGVQVRADPSAVGVGSAPIGGFPTAGDSYLVLSTGTAAGINGNPGAFSSTDLPGAPAGVDGNDLTQVVLDLTAPTGATCFGFDVAFLSEEFPEFVNRGFNDSFTAELNTSAHSLVGGQVIAPNNFAFDSAGNALSIDTVFGVAEATGTAMDGTTPALSAVSPIEERPDGTMAVILSIQDLGDSVFDSAVIVDNLRWLYGENCTPGASPLTDTDGDGLSDLWETEGIDYDGDGSPEVDLPAIGADPLHQDIFIEVDWMERDGTCVWFVCWGGRSFAPQQPALNDVRAAFAAAPVSNPDGSTGIRMHLDSGPGSVMDPISGETWGTRSRSNEVTYDQSLGTISGSEYNWAEFQAIKDDHFDLFRNDVFHYVVYADTFAGVGNSGISRGILAADLLVTDGADNWGGGFTRTQERGTFMHELGHNLSLLHGGDIEDPSRTDYASIMSYDYQLIGLPPNSRLDYSRGVPFVDWDHLRFDGGSIGSLGDSAPPPVTTPGLDELDHETALQLDAVALDGDGTATFLGPTLLVAGQSGQELQFDVSNAGTAPATYTLELSSGTAGLTGSASIVLDGQGAGRIAIAVSGDVPPGEHTFSATLRSDVGGPDLYTLQGAVTSVDPDDQAIRSDMADALDQLAGLGGGSGLDPVVQVGLTDTLNAALARAPAPGGPPVEGAPTVPPTTTEPAGSGSPSASPGASGGSASPGSPTGRDGSSGATSTGTAAQKVAYTGFEVWPVLWLAGGAVLFGLALVLIGRKRRRRARGAPHLR